MKELQDKKKELCIYCRGAYAIRTYLRLRELGVHVSCFGDADPNKSGYVLDGVFCISYPELIQKDRRNTVILVCREKPEALIEQFHALGFCSVYSHEIVPEESGTEVTLDQGTLNAIRLFHTELNQIRCGPPKGAWEKETEDRFLLDLERVLQDAQDRKEVAGGCRWSSGTG